MPSIHQQMAKRAAAGVAKPASHKGRWIIAVVCFLFVATGAAVAVAYALHRPVTDPRLTEVRTMRDEFLTDGKLPDMRNPLNMIKVAAIAAKVIAMPPDLQQKFMRESMAARMRLVMSLPNDQMMAEIDKDIALGQGMRKFGPMRGPDKDGGKSDSSAKSSGPSGAAGGTGSGAAPAQSGQAGGPPVGPRTDAQRKQWINSMLSSVPPENRAQWNQYQQLTKMRALQTGQTLPNGR
jgi:hypothetical protein